MKLSIAALLVLIPHLCLAQQAMGLAGGIVQVDSARMLHLNSFNPHSSTFDIRQPVPLNFATRDYGFFCRQELQLQKIHVPVTFRLGSMIQCNQLEGK